MQKQQLFNTKYTLCLISVYNLRDNWKTHYYYQTLDPCSKHCSRKFIFLFYHSLSNLWSSYIYSSSTQCL